MGLLIIDHSQGQGIDGKQGRKIEYDTVACAHCNGVIAILSRGLNKFILSSIDVAVATTKAHEAGQHFVANCRCSRCHSNICRRCSMWMEQHGGTCPGPFKAKVEAAMNKRRDADRFAYQYRRVSR